jgi:hypothetical protein
LVAWSGAAVVGLTLASIAAAPLAEPLGAGSTEALVRAYADGRDAILLGLYLGGLAWSSAFLVFVAALYRELRSPPDEVTSLLATVGLAGGAINVAAILPSLVFLSWAAFEAAAAEPVFLQRVYHAGALANNFTGFATAVCVGGFSAALRRVGFPSWLVALGAAVGLHHLASAGALAREGVWSPTGPISTTAPLGMTLWVGCVALLTWLRRNRV